MVKPNQSEAKLFAGLNASQRSAASEAVRALQSGRPEAASRHFDSLLAQAPEHPDLLRLAGMAQRMSGRHAEAEATLERAREAAPEDPLVAASLGLVRLAQGRQASGLDELRRACEMAPHAGALWNNLGKALIDCNRVEEAVEPLRKAVELQPKLSPPRFSLAYALTVSGEAEAAAEQYRILLAQRPEDGEVWMGLAQLKTGELDDDDIARMRALQDKPGLDVGDRIALDFALGQALHDRKDYPGAFTAYREGNALTRKRKSWDAGRFSALVDRTLAMDWPQPPAGEGPPQVLFLVGLPRSGTSLTEQILGMHSRVVAGGELDIVGRDVHDAAEREGGVFPEGLAGMDRAQWQALGETYLEHARSVTGPAPVLTDKRPGNWLFVGALMNMLPEAKVIVCRRDPVEVGFSCFRNRFSYDHQLFSYDFESIAAYWHDFDRACRHWQARFPGRVMDSSYEALLENPEQAIRVLLDFCGLDFEPDCLHPERTRQVVRTLSATQVRKPLRKGSAVSERYGALLDPLREALAAYR